jgi:hypothetical protein
MDPLAILKEIEKQSSDRIGRANLFDSNVCTSPRNPERPWEHLALPNDFFRHKLNIKFGVHKVELLANGDFISVRVAGNLNTDLCSINRRDKVFQLVRNVLVERSFCLFPVYSRQADTDLRQLLSSAALNEALKCLQLTEDESLHIYRNGIVLYLRRNSTNDVMFAIEAACRLTEQLGKKGDKEQLDLTGLPRKFENLFGLIPKWAISDDEMRGEMLSETSQDALQSFVDVVGPYLPEIDDFLMHLVKKNLPREQSL